MKVIFLQNIKGVAQIGDVKEAADGYVRNFLLPRKMVIPATPKALNKVEELKKKREKTYAKTKEEALNLADKLKDVKLEITADANENGNLYGSIGEKDIAGELRKQGFLVKEEQINVPDHLKTTGEHEIELDLHPEAKTKIKVLIKSPN